MSKRDCYLVLLLPVLCFNTQLAKGEVIAFLPGDASVVAVMTEDSELLTGKELLNSAKGFCWARYPDTTIGGRLDISTIPQEQLASTRKELRKAIQSSGQRAALVSFCSPAFQFETSWLGVPYNDQVRIRVRPGSVVANNFGVEGIANISARFAAAVPALPLQRIDAETIKVAGQVTVCVLRIEDAALQKARTIIKTDGAVEKKTFNYSPKLRVGYEEGDAFFIGKADAFQVAEEQAVQLNYLEFPRSHCDSVFADGKQRNFRSEHIDALEESLEVRAQGSKLVVRGLSSDTLRRIRQRLIPFAGREWYAFVVAKDYQPNLYGLGARYNRQPIDSSVQQLRIEYLDCMAGPASYPKMQPTLDWPPALKVNWVGSVAEVNCKDVQVYFVRYFEGLRLAGDAVAESKFRLFERNRLESLGEEEKKTPGKNNR